MSKSKSSIAAMMGIAVSLATAASAQNAGHDANYARFRPTDEAIAAVHSPAYRRCMQRSGGVTIAMRECSSAEFDRVDVRLNANYRQIMRRLRAPEQQRLRAAQRRWLASRWTMCDNLPDYEGGTLDLIIRDNCVLGELTRRTLWLAQL